MPLMSQLQPYANTRTFTQEFRGLNRTERCGDGEMADMWNLSSDHYPVLATRKRRALKYRADGPIWCMLQKGENLWYISESFAGDRLYCNGEHISEVDDLLDRGARQMVSMGAYITIWPGGAWVNTAKGRSDPEFCGSINNSVTMPLSKTVTMEVRNCDREGNPIVGAHYGPNAPASPSDGDIWFDTTDKTAVVANKWVVSTRMWVVMDSVYIKVSYPGIGHGFKKYDGVKFSGRIDSYISGWQVLEDVAEDGSYVIVTGVYPSPGDLTVGTVTMERTAPNMSHVVECNNRLWGCSADPELNEIYACALGDFTNWNRFQGISTDSYAASRGSDGEWTGAVTYKGKPHFFKENCIEIVYPSNTGAHEIVTNQCRGVFGGLSRGAIGIVNEVLYYYTGREVLAYDGTQPVSISAALGPLTAGGAVGWGHAGKLYLSIIAAVETDETMLLVYDTRLGIWHKEKSRPIHDMASGGDKLYFATEEGDIWVTPGAEYDGDPEGPIDWMMETGDLGLSTHDRTYTSRFILRLLLDKGSSADLYVQYDSDGQWEHKGHITCGPWLQTRALPILPRRCDHMRFRLTGKGDAKIYSIERVVEGGSDKP